MIIVILNMIIPARVTFPICTVASGRLESIGPIIEDRMHIAMPTKVKGVITTNEIMS